MRFFFRNSFHILLTFQEKSEAEEQICQIQKMWETEKAKEAEKISDLVKARELLLDSKGMSMSFYPNFIQSLSIQYQDKIWIK